jgi:hypothetical protein
MSKVVVINHVTLDGVMQSPGRPARRTHETASRTAAGRAGTRTTSYWQRRMRG